MMRPARVLTAVIGLPGVWLAVAHWLSWPWPLAWWGAFLLAVFVLLTASRETLAQMPARPPETSLDDEEDAEAELLHQGVDLQRATPAEIADAVYQMGRAARRAGRRHP